MQYILTFEIQKIFKNRCINCDKEFVMSDLNDKLRIAEERETTLLVELSELREQNELLEFRLLELEETSARKDSPAHAVDSIVSELSLANKDHLITKQRSRAIATVLPYTNNTITKTAPSVLPRKPPFILQESGIFNEEEEEKKEEWEEHEEKIELASRSTQTEAPSSKLLQEVQRLQELRARIQERVKIITPVSHSVDSSKICFDITAMNSIIQLASYQERVYDLEKKLEVYEEAEKIRECEKQLSKQQKEKLLDENYRLTEKIYWLETKLHHIMQSRFGENNRFSQNTANGEKTTVARLKENTEQIQDLENIEAGMQDQAKITETCVNKVIVKCLQYKDQINVNSDQIVSGILHSAMVQQKKKKIELHKFEEQVIINYNKSDSGKKVRQRRFKDKEHEILSAKMAAKKNIRFIRDNISFKRGNYPLVLYQEICV